MNRNDVYDQLIAQVKCLVEGECNEVGALANVSAAIHEALNFFWVGFYLVRGDELVLGPFQGSVACYHIPYNKGVCGTAWARGETLVVDNVEMFPGHIACSNRSRSEIVVPVFNASDEVVAVLDIDSTALAAFGETDRRGLQAICQLLSANLYSR